MIEIFRTNVTGRNQAEIILNKIHSAFPGYIANFDLDDCDHVLRVDSQTSMLCNVTIIQLLQRLGFEADVLPDIVQEDFALDIEK
jgi:hypothetical protein